MEPKRGTSPSQRRPPHHRIAQTALGMVTKIKQLCGLDIYIFYIYICIYRFFSSIYRWMEKQRSLSAI